MTALIRRLRWAALLPLLLLPCAAPAQTLNDFFDDSVLQRIDIAINPADWATLKQRYLENTHYPITLTWRNVSVDCAARSRGIGSRSAIKPGLDVFFDYYDPTNRFLGLRKLDLINDVQDASLMRERLAQKDFTKMGLTASRETHGRLFVNGENLGVYNFAEPIDYVYLQNHLGENTGDLFKFVYPTTASPWYFTYKGTDLSQYVPVPFKPETNKDFPNSALLENWVRTVNNSNPSNFQSQAGTVMDVNQALTFIAVEQAQAEHDGFIGDFGINNFYPYRQTSNKLIVFLPWDKDNAFWSVDRDIFLNANQNVLTQKALAVPALKTFFLQQVVKAAQVQDSFMADEIEREYALIKDAVYADQHRFTEGADGNQTPCDIACFEADVSYLRKFARGRLASVLAQAAAAGYTVGPPPVLGEGGAVNAATFSPTVLAPGSLISVFGQNMSTGTGGASSLPLPTQLFGGSISFNSVLAPVLFASPGQFNVQLPWEIQAGTATVTATANGVKSNSISANIGPYSPGIFAVAYPDGTPVNSSKPAAAGDVLVIYGNGLGPVSPAVATGAASPSQPPLAQTTATPTVTIGSVQLAPGDILFSGMAPFFVGLNQINVRVPAGVAPASATPVVIQIGGQSSPPFTIATR